MATLATFRSPAAVALAGSLSLAVAMGIGRFALTPVLPLMVREGQITLAQGSWLAAANYLGYLAGALLAARLRVSASTLSIGCLAAIAVSTAAMALPYPMPWLVSRFVAGVCSAGVFVATSVWCLAFLAQCGRQELAGWVYAGVGAGITLAGLFALTSGVFGLGAGLLWVLLGALAALMSIPVFLALRVVLTVAAGQPATVPAPSVIPRGTVGLVLCYGVMGFGYILPATFLPVLARTVVDDPRLFGLAWPIFGATAVVATLAAGASMRRCSRLKVWAYCQALMGVGALLPGLWLSGMTVLVSALLVGGTFMVITLAGVQEIRARVSWNSTVWVSHLTSAFALGQITGPAASALLLLQSTYAAEALQLGLLAAAAALLVTATWLWRQSTPSLIERSLQNAP